MKDNDDVPDPRESVKAKMREAAQQVQAGMFCEKDNRLCYRKYDGTCGAYTPDNVLDHTTQIVCPNLFSDSHDDVLMCC